MAPINLPDGSQVSEIVLPDGSTASEVLAPDGSRVFSAIPDSPPDQGLVYHYNAAESPLSDGDSVPDIDDQSGNGNTATLDTGGATYRTGGVGNNPYYELVDDLYLTPQAHATSLSGYSLYLVYTNNQHPPASGSDRSFQFSENTGLFPFSDSTTFYMGIGDQGTRWVDNAPADDTSIANALVAYGDGSNNSITQHNANRTNSLGSQSQSTYTFSSEFHFGGAKTIESDLQFYEFIFYNRYLNSSERSDVETYLSDKYGLVF